MFLTVMYLRFCAGVFRVRVRVRVRVIRDENRAIRCSFYSDSVYLLYLVMGGFPHIASATILN